MLKPRDIANKSFEKASRGYKFEDVDIFMSEVTMSYTKLYETNQQLEQQLEVLAEKIEEYRESEDSLRSVLLGAQKLGDNIVRESRAKAEVMLQEANAKADAIVAKAIDKSKDILIENEAKIAKGQSELDSLKRDVAEFKKDLLSLYRRHFELIAEIPDYDGEDQEDTTGEEPENIQSEVSEVDIQTENDSAASEPQQETSGFRVEENYEPEPETVDEQDKKDDADFESVAKEYNFSGLKFQFTDEIDKKK